MLLEGQKVNDRADVIVRVFHMKLDALLDDIKIGKLFGPVNAILYSIEFQKTWLTTCTYLSMAR
jgi:hypothetical protein